MPLSMMAVVAPSATARPDTLAPSKATVQYLHPPTHQHSALAMHEPSSLAIKAGQLSALKVVVRSYKCISHTPSG